MSDVDVNLAEAIGTDVRYVAITWNGDELPELHLGGCSEYEALGLLVAAVKRLKVTCALLLDFPGDFQFDAEPDDDDEDDE